MEKKEVNQVAMLMRLKVSNWGASKKDDQESKEVCERNHALNGSANVFVQLIPKSELKSLQRAAYNVKKIWWRYTLPWIDDGIGILPASCFDRCDKEVTAGIEIFQQKVEEFLERYPDIVKNASPNLGELLKNNPLPTAEEVRSKFKIEVNYLPIPSAKDFKVTGKDIAVDRIRRNITNSVNSATQAAITGLYDELYELVKKIKETTNVKDKIFRDSLIGNLKDFCERLPELNIIQDEKLNEISQEVFESLAKVDPEDLRKDKKLRKATSAKADELLENIRKIDLDLD